MTVRTVPDQFATITAAVAASASGDTVKIGKVILTESVIIPAGKDRLTIIGEGPENTIIDGAGAPVFTIAGSSQVTIQALTAQNTPTNGIEIFTNANVIRKVEVRKAGTVGINVNIGSWNLFDKCDVHDNGEHGMILASANNYVIKCMVQDNILDGIILDGPGNLVVKSIFKDNGGNGISISDNYNLLIKNEYMKNGGNGIKLNNADQTRIIKNDVEDSEDSGITQENDSGQNMVAENDVKDSNNAGIFIDSTSDNNPIHHNDLDKDKPDTEVHTGSTGNRD